MLLYVCYSMLLQVRYSTLLHREHTLLLNRKRVNKGLKRTNSLPLSPLLMWPYCRENRYLQVLLSTVALNSNLGFSVLCNFFFALCIKFDKAGNSLHKHFECNSNIRSNLWISLLSRNQTNTKRTRKISTTRPNLFLNTLTTVRDFKRLLQSFFSNHFLRHDGTVLPVPVASTNVRSGSIPSPTHAFWHNKSLHTPLPARSFSYAHKVGRSPHENERAQVNTWSILARFRVKNWQLEKDFVNICREGVSKFQHATI